MHTLYQERRALGSRVQLALVMDNTSKGEELFRSLWLQILYFEKRCSRFLPDSELSQFNRAAGVRQYIGPELLSLLHAAKNMAERTGGLYNPFVLPALQRAGYVSSREPGHVDDYVDNFANRQVVPAGRLELGEGWATIPYGTALDLGGCGKGYIGDQLAGFVQAAQDLHGYWFSIGGDTVTGGYDEYGKPWKIYIQPNPASSERAGVVAAPHDGRPFAVATSSTRYRRGKAGSGADWHHLIDPRTGKPAETSLSLATVCGPSLLLADVLASCTIIAGPEAAPDLMARAGEGEVLAAAWQAGATEPLATFGSAIQACQ